MAETITPRFGLNQWSADTDTVSRPEFNNSFAKVESLGAIDKQGLTTARPAPGVVGTYFYATDTGLLWRDTGSAWVQVGARLQGTDFKPVNVSGQAMTLTGLANQSGDLMRARNSAGTVLSSIDKNGGYKSGGVYVASNADVTGVPRLYDASLSVQPLKPTQPAQVTMGLAGQTANLQEYRTSNGVLETYINAVGQLTTSRATKANDTNATSDNEFVTFGQVKRSLPEFTFKVVSLSQYNALLVKDSKTLYVIVG